MAWIEILLLYLHQVCQKYYYFAITGPNLSKLTLTIILLSDHGDLMGEHAKVNKGRPYQTSVSPGNK